MSIGLKLNKVMAACRYMAKDGRNDFQKYDYTTAASIFGKINEAKISKTAVQYRWTKIKKCLEQNQFNKSQTGGH